VNGAIESKNLCKKDKKKEKERERERGGGMIRRGRRGEGEVYKACLRSFFYLFYLFLAKKGKKRYSKH